MITIVVAYFVYLTLTSIYFIAYFNYVKQKMVIFNKKINKEHVFNIIKINEGIKDLIINTSVLKKGSVIKLFLNSRYNPINKEISIFLIDDNSFDLVTINVAIHEFCHYFMDENKNKKLSNSLRFLSIITKLISIPLVIILLLVTISQIVQFNYLIDLIFISNTIIIVSYFIIFYGLIITPLEYRVSRLSLKTIISMKILDNEESHFYKKMNKLSLIGHIITQILIILLFIMIFVAYFFFRNKYK